MPSLNRQLFKDNLDLQIKMTGRDVSQAKNVFMSVKGYQLIHAKVCDTDSMKRRDVKLQMLYYPKQQVEGEASLTVSIFLKL